MEGVGTVKENGRLFAPLDHEDFDRPPCANWIQTGMISLMEADGA